MLSLKKEVCPSEKGCCSPRKKSLEETFREKKGYLG